MLKILVPIESEGVVIKHTLEPISSIKQIERIFILRNKSDSRVSKAKYITVPNFFHPFSLFCQIYKIINGLRIVKKENIDLIAPYYIFPHGIIGYFIAKIANKPIVFSLMGNAEEIIFAKRDMRLFSFLIQDFLSGFNIITTTGSVGKKYLVSLGIPSNKIHHLPDSIDTKRFHPRQVEKKYDIISLGRLGKDKNVKLILYVFYLMKRIKSKIRMCVVGSGPEEYRLKSISKKLNIVNDVDFCGYRKNTDDYFSLSKIYICSSINEGMPMAMLEAMASGVGVITSNVGDIPDLAKDNYNALVIQDSNDIKSFFEATRLILSDNKLYDKLTKNALFEVRKRFDYNAASDAWIGILSQLFKEKFRLGEKR